MNNADKDRFFRDTFALARTMIIKIEPLAKRYNKALERAGYSVSEDKRTWRYYMNMNGDYHETDVPMVIRSLDTDDEIVFNKENLRFHLATFREYSRGGYWFKRLIAQYPAQPTLIRGILQPISYDETIGAENYKILRYNQDLVLWNETQLIPKLQKFINAEVEQIFKNDYITTDDLFLPTMVRLMYADIIKAIHTIRVEDMYTRHSHDFYIWSHIDSYGDFSKYKNSLNRYQTMWLFRNIAWIKKNPGQMYTFDKLMENLLTVANIPLAKYDMVEGTETQIEDLTPTPLYRRLHLNLIESYGREPAYIDTAALIQKQVPLAKDNFNFTSIYQEDAIQRGESSLHSELPTKALESSMRDYTNRHADTLMSVVYNEWIYLAGNGKFNGRVIVNDPKSGKQIRLPVTDAYHVWKYLVEYSNGNTPVEICPAYYQNVMKIRPPTIDQIIDIGGPEFVYPAYLAFDIRDIWFPVANFVAPDYLIQYSFEVYEAMWKHKKLYSQFYDLNKRARVKNATKTVYESGVVKVGNQTRYDELLKAYNLDFSDYTAADCKSFAWDIFKRVTGWDTNIQPNMRVKQSDLIEIMTRLSSYTIHVIKEMDDDVAVTELYNEVFVGDSRWTGPGNSLIGDFKNVMLNVQSNMDGIRSLDSVLKVFTPIKPKIVADLSSEIRLTDHSHIKAVNVSKDPWRYAVRMVDNSYFRKVADDTPMELIIPDTYYGVLGSGTGFLQIPDTYYGLLGSGEQFLRIPNTYYGELGDKYKWLEVPPTYYGVLKGR